MADQWLSIVEYARCFNISDMTVRRRIKNGRLDAVLREGKYYIPMPADDAELQGHPPSDRSQLRSHRSHQIHGNDEVFSEDSWVNQNQSSQSRSVSHHSLPRHDSSDKRRRPSVPQRRFASHYEQNKEASGNPGGPSFNRTESHSRQHDRVVATKFPIERTVPTVEVDKESVTFRAQTLFNLCENSIQKLQEQKELLEGSYKDRFAALEEKAKSLESVLREKEMKIGQLSQKCEDLQLLVKIIEGSQKMRA